MPKFADSAGTASPVLAGEAGYTLVELLVAVALIAVAAGWGIPAFSAWTASARVTSAANEMLGAILFTRSEAMKRRHRVVLCKSADGEWCATTGDWRQGWMIFDDPDGNGLRSAAEELLHRRQALGTSVRLKGNGSVAGYVSYAPDGATRLVGGGFQAGTLTVCDSSQDASIGRQIVINANGRPRIQSVAIESCL